MSHALPRPYNDKFVLATHHASPAQSEILRCMKRIQVTSAGRRFGKSHGASARALQVCSDIPGAAVVIMAPTLLQVKKIYARLLKALLPKQLIVTFNKSELTFTLVNGSTIELVGSEAYERLRGRSLTYIILDEVSSFRCTLDDLLAVIRPALSDQRKMIRHPLAGGMLAISTPDGTKGMFAELFEMAESDEYPDWQSFQFTTLDGGNVTYEEVMAAKAEMDVAKFRAEYLASFTAGNAHRVIHAFDERCHITELAEDDGVSEIAVGLDFNTSELCAVLSRRIGRHGSSYGGVLAFDCIPLINSHTQAMADEIANRYPGRKIRVCPDASGSQRKTSAGGNTDHSILRNAGFIVDTPQANPAVSDRVNTVNWALRAADGNIRTLIHPRAKRLITCIQSQTFVRTASGLVPDKGQSGGDDYSGMNDALGYLICRSLPMPDRGRRVGVSRVEGVG